MSKASEWCIKHNDSEHRRPEFSCPYENEGGRECESRVIASVSNYGTLHLRRFAILDASQAVEFGRWLIDTFDEPPESKGRETRGEE